MSKKQKKDNTLELIKLVDKKYTANSLYFLLSPEFGIPLLLLFSVWGLFVLYYASIQNTPFLPLPTLLTLIIAFFALFFSVTAQVNKNRLRILIERNYFFILRDYSEKDLSGKVHIWGELVKPFFAKYAVQDEKQDPLLKAIITVKSKNPEVNLESEYIKNKALLCEKRLMENLLYSNSPTD